MSITGNENQDTPAEPAPVDDENDEANSGPEKESEPTKTPSPGTTTDPRIKNN